MKYTIIVSIGRFPNITAAANAEKEIDWWDDSKLNDQRTCTLCWAAEELKRFLPGECSIFSDNDNPAFGDNVILVGGADENRYTAELENELDKQLCCTSKVKNSLRMLGLRHEGKNYIVLSGADRVGTLYAAYTYLERQGVHFIEPGEPSHTAPDTDPEFDITESPSFDARGAMSSFINGDINYIEWAARNKFNTITLKRPNGLNHTQKKLGIDTVDGGHKIFYTFIQPHEEYPYNHKLYPDSAKPDDPYPVSELCRKPSGECGIFTYGDAHPEWYALIDGVRRMKRFPESFIKRGGAAGDNICTGNENATHELCTQIVDALADGMWKYIDYLNLWPIDNGTWCECEKCVRQGSYSRRILLLAYKLDKYIKKARAENKIRRDIHIICPAYHETMQIPDAPLPDDFDYSTCSVVFYPIERCYLHDINDPVCKETNQIIFNDLLPWTENKTYSGDLVIGEYYNVSAFAGMPFVLSTRITNEIPLYYSIGVRQFHYMHMTARDWGFIAINNYLHGKLIWNTEYDPKELRAQYFRARYGSGLAEQMEAIYNKLELAAGNCKYYKHYQYVNGRTMGLFKHLITNETAITEEMLFTSAHMKLDSRADDPQAGPSLKETLDGFKEVAAMLGSVTSSCGDPEVKLQLTRDKRRLDYGIRMTEFLYLMCLCSMGQSEHLEKLRSIAEEMENDTESMQCYDYGLNFDNALTASWVSKVYYNKFSEKKDDGTHINGIAL